MEIANFLLGGFLGSLLTTFISYSLSIHFQKYLKYRKRIKAIRKLKMGQKYSFSILYQLVRECVYYNPDCLVEPKKLYKDLHLSKAKRKNEEGNGLTQEDIKKALVSLAMNVEGHRREEGQCTKVNPMS